MNIEIISGIIIVIICCLVGVQLGWYARERRLLMNRYNEAIKHWAESEIDRMCIHTNLEFQMCSEICINEISWRAMRMAIDRLQWVRTCLDQECQQDGLKEYLIAGINSTLNELEPAQEAHTDILGMDESEPSSHGKKWNKREDSVDEMVKKIRELLKLYKEDWDEEYTNSIIPELDNYQERR